ncbi:MAG: PAS domain S-box protein [Candidatus Eremiobacteraeota bacterium]|nr:PAS domain S-box protein [Candidatus Eremiobacteraeota bacterium]
MKIRNLFTGLKIYIFLIAIIPTVLITLLVFFISKDIITQSLSHFSNNIRGLHRSSLIVNKYLKDYLDGQVNIVEGTVNNPEFRNADKFRKEEIINNSLKDRDSIKEVKYFNNNLIQEFDFYTPSNTNKWAASSFDRKWIESALEGKVVQSRVFIENGEPWMNVSVPVLTTDNSSVAGVLSIYISLQNIFNRLDNFIRKDKDLAYIINKNGTVIYVSRQMQSVFPEIQLGENLLSSSFGGFNLENVNNEVFLTSSLPIGDTGWQLVWKSRMTELSGASQRLVLNITGAFLLALLFSLLLSYYVARRISRPLEDLSVITGEMTEENKEKDIPRKKESDEIGSMSLSFEEMKHKLRKYMDDKTVLYSKTKERLEKRVIELRTIHTATEAFTSIKSKQELMNYIVDQIQGTLSGKFCNLYLKDESGKYVIKASKTAISADSSNYKLEEFPIDREPYSEVLASQKALIIHDASREDTLNGRFLGREVGAYCVFPLIVSEELSGILELGLKEEKDLIEDSIRLLITLAKEASIGIENASLYQKMSEEKKKMEILLSTISDGVISMDTNGVITSFNKSAERITGYMEKEAVGKICNSIFIGIHPGDLPDTRVFCSKKGCLLKIALDKGQFPVQTEHIVVTPGGEKRTLEFTTTIEKSGKNGEVSFVSIMRDVSQIKELENLRSDFIATISHELRTPLTSIKGYISTLLHPRGRFSKEEVKEFLEIINEETDHLNRMINDLLEASKLSRDTLIIKPMPFKINGIILNMIKRYQSTSSKHVFVTEIDGTPFIYGDSNQIEFVICHLLENAIKFSPGGGQVRVNVVAQEEEVMIMVEDQGVGIPMQHREKVFELFHRVDTRTTRKFYGPGLGLFISKRIIEAHNGKIWVESGLLGGSKFVFTLPRVPNEEDEDSCPGVDED